MVYRIAHEVITDFEILKAACSQGKLVFKSFQAPQHDNSYLHANNNKTDSSFELRE